MACNKEESGPQSTVHRSRRRGTGNERILRAQQNSSYGTTEATDTNDVHSFDDDDQQLNLSLENNLLHRNDMNTSI